MAKKIMILLFIIHYVPGSLAQTASTSSLQITEVGNVVSLGLKDLFINPDLLRTSWIDEPVPLTFYSEEAIGSQKLINEIVAEAVLTYSPIHNVQEWIDIDHEEITPHTWKWVYMNLPEKDGTVTNIILRRPNHWIKEVEADSVGRVVYINLPEMGAQGWATVTKIIPSQVDTRLWNENRRGDFVSRPITGKFIHESDNVYDLYFDNHLSPLGVTANHRIWSLDRESWIEANELQIGEKVKTRTNNSTLLKKIKRDGKQKVYNLEIYRDHNFFVSQNSILAHNGCLQHTGEWIELEKHVLRPGGIPMLLASSERNGVARYFIKDMRNGKRMVDEEVNAWIDIIKTRIKENGITSVELRLGKNVLSRLKKIPEDGMYRGTLVTYDKEKRLLNFLIKKEDTVDDEIGGWVIDK